MLLTLPSHQLQLNAPVKKSLREREEEDSEQDLWYSVTPEVRSFIARKLTEMLERETKVIVQNTQKQDKEPPPQETGIRLFTTSSHVCVHPSDPVLPSPQQPGRKCRKVSSSSSSDGSEDERLASVAVTEEDLMHEREMYRNLQKLDSVDIMDQTSSSHCSSSAHQVIQVSQSTSAVSSVQHNSHSCDKSKQAKEQILKRKGKGHNAHLSSKTGYDDKLEVKLSNDCSNEYRMSSDARQKQSDPQESDTHKKIATESSLLVHGEQKKKKKET
ncbi:hypothetical protein C0Q70_08166 [Pomacea canaliculata]|uniref:Protein CUSTOS n=1 Tax=Pomacea canaliculata TaxID=400727 RepID=A0A2T7PH25_POMCA|nr:uncharacterized protein LOC112561747 [Pomacea canaliculata]PVD32721.1 hypothetical protein C0Q70_08166 [Pomacea canaliculata]